MSSSSAPTRVAGAVGDERAEGGLPGEQHLGGALAGACGERDRQARDGQAGQRGEQQQPPLDVRPQEQAEPADRACRAGPPAPRSPAPSRNSATVGEPTWGRPGMASENVPSPVQASRPMKISEPTPAASRPGTSTSSSMDPPSPEASISRNAPVSGRAEQGADGGEAAGRGHHRLGSGRSVPLGEPDREDAKAAAEGDQRRLGAEHHAQAQGGEGGEHDAGKLDRGWRALARLEPVGRRVAAGAGQVPDGEARPAPRPAPAAEWATTAARRGSRGPWAGR